MPNMISGYALDIANSEDWDDGIWLNFFKDRLVKMRAKRSPFDEMWDNQQNQENAVSFYDNEGNLQVNIPLEKTLKEIYMGRTEGKVNFDIIPDGQANVEELQPTKFAMNFFMDGNGKDNFWKENKILRENKSSLGSGIFYTGIRSYKDFRYVTKKDARIEGDTDILNKSNFEKHTNETWFFFPKAIHPKDFFIDDAAYGQTDVQYADDCIYKEKITAIEFNNRYGKNSAFINTDKVQYWSDINPKNKEDRPVDVRQIVVYHYFHRITKTYLIVCNEQTLIYNGLYLYEDGKLPFVNVQHYSRPDRFWGEGINERVAYLKAYKSEIMQDILQGAAMSSGIHLLVGNDDEIGQDWTVGGRQLNLWRTTGGAERVQQMNTSPNLTYFTAVLSLLDKEITINSGINPTEQFEASSDKVGIVEIMEANKSVRNRSVDENYNIGLDEALTMMLSRVKQFAPSLLKTEIKDSEGKTLKIIFPTIRIDNYKVEKEGGKQVFVEAIGKYGYFDLKPDVVQGVGVKIITPSTNSVLPILERQKVTEFLNNLSQLAVVAQTDPTGESLRKLQEFMNLEQLIEWMSDAYGYDSNGLKASSEKDKIASENKKKLEQLSQLLSINQPENVQPTQPVQPTGGNTPAQPTMGQTAPQMQPAGAGTGF